MSLNAFSQTSIDGGLQYPDPRIEYSMVIPKEYSFTHKPQLSFRKNDDKKQVMVFDENLNMAKTFTINDDRQFEYKVKYQNEERTVTEVKENIVYKERSGLKTARMLMQVFRNHCFIFQNKKMEIASFH
jgi:hypothetical protein